MPFEKRPKLKWLMEHADHVGDDCLFFPFPLSQCGYGTFMAWKKTMYAHRLMCEVVNGPPPTPTHHAAHSCGRGQHGCVNPLHLSWKTNSENQLDRRKHGTHKNGKRWKLTPKQVAEIRSVKGLEPVIVTARRFGVTDNTIRQIRSGRIWRTGQYAAGGFTPETSRAARARQKARAAIASTRREP